MCLYIVLLLTVSFIYGARGLCNVTLHIIPPVVERGKTVELICRYDLQGAPLYTIKFYRGTHEFYRYSPNDVPSIKLFPFNGLEVDLSSSQGSSVVIQKADYSLAGNVSCEVSTDAPHFSTLMTTKCLTVVELPKKPPDITVEPETEAGGYWAAGDTLRATCTSAPARPAPTLTWFINDEPALTTSTRWRQAGSLESRSVTLSTRLLARHLALGSPVVKCTAMVLDVYKETAYRVLGPTTLREPRHERVQSSSRGYSDRPPSATLVLVLPLAFALVTR